MDVDAKFLNSNDFFKREFYLSNNGQTCSSYSSMAYLVCKSSNNFEEALLKIRQGIQHFNGLHASKLTVGFHETMTQLWAILIWNATQKCDTSISDSNAFIDLNSEKSLFNGFIIMETILFTNTYVFTRCKT